MHSVKRKNEHTVRRRMEAENSEAVLFTIEDDDEESFLRSIAQMNSCRLEHHGQELKGEADGTIQLEENIHQKAIFVEYMNTRPGGVNTVLLLEENKVDI